MENETRRTLRIVVLGGGTGSYTLLTGLKRIPDAELAAIASIADNGGSSGILRDELGVLPPGDIRQCLAALADEDEQGSEPHLLRRLLSHRFERGDGLRGHTLGNILLAGLEDMFRDPLQAVRAAHQILRVAGRVIPVSASSGNLHAELEDGTRVVGEDAIEQAGEGRSAIARCFLDPEVEANPEALAAIREADALVFAPGDLYTSLIPVLLVRDVADAIRQSLAQRFYVVNLVTKRGQTDGYGATRFVSTVERFLGGARLHHVLLNNGVIPDDLLAKYEKEGEFPVVDDLPHDDPRVMRADFVGRDPIPTIPGDALKRSLIRHDPYKSAGAILARLTAVHARPQEGERRVDA